MKTNQKQKNKVLFILFIVSLFFVVEKVNAQTWIETWNETQNQIKENTQQIENIESKMIDLKNNYRLLYDGAKNQNDQLSNQISYSGYILTVLGLLLAWYINRQYEKIKEMKEIVEKTKEYIDENDKELYEKIKRDETVGLLNRLKEVPEDVSNICSLLLSRDLLEEDYECLKKAYLKAKEGDSIKNVTDQYIVLLMQHFPYLSLKDSDLRAEMITYINVSLLNNMFERDVSNLFGEIFKYLKEFGVTDEENKTIIKNLFKGYFDSRFKENERLQTFIKRIILRSGVNILIISSIAKEQNLENAIYTDWVNMIL